MAPGSICLYTVAFYSLSSSASIWRQNEQPVLKKTCIAREPLPRGGVNVASTVITLIACKSSCVSVVGLKSKFTQKAAATRTPAPAASFFKGMGLLTCAMRCGGYYRHIDRTSPNSISGAIK